MSGYYLDVCLQVLQYILTPYYANVHSRNCLFGYRYVGLIVGPCATSIYLPGAW